MLVYSLKDWEWQQSYDSTSNGTHLSLPLKKQDLHGFTLIWEHL